MRNFVEGLYAKKRLLRFKKLTITLNDALKLARFMQFLTESSFKRNSKPLMHTPRTILLIFSILKLFP